MVDRQWDAAYGQPGGSNSGAGPVLGAVTAGLVAAVVGALLWTVVVEFTGYRIGFVAVGIGLLVGQTVALTTSARRRLPVAAALLTLVGCLLGDLFVDVYDVAWVAEMSSPALLWQAIIHPDLLWVIFTNGFELVNVVFWAAGAAAAYRLAVRGADRTSAGPAARAVAGPEFTGHVTNPAQAEAQGYPAHPEVRARPYGSVPEGSVAPPLVARRPADFFSSPGTTVQAPAAQQGLGDQPAEPFTVPRGPARSPKAARPPRTI